MEKIDLDKVYGTAINLPKECYYPNCQISWQKYVELLASRVIPMIHGLQKDGIIKWFCFFCHPKAQVASQGIEILPDDTPLYIHIRLEVIKDIELGGYLFLHYPDSDCRPPTKDNSLKTIHEIDISLLKNVQIEEAWKIIGDISGLVLNMIDAHSKPQSVMGQHFHLFLHYFCNSFGIINRNNPILVKNSNNETGLWIDYDVGTLPKNT